LENNKSFCINCKYNFTYEPSTKEKYCFENINSETIYSNKETDKINITYESKTNEKDSDTIKTEFKIDISTEAFNTEDQKRKSDRYKYIR
jgi:hypothetical protein